MVDGIRPSGPTLDSDLSHGADAPQIESRRTRRSPQSWPGSGSSSASLDRAPLPLPDTTAARLRQTVEPPRHEPPASDPSSDPSFASGALSTVRQALSWVGRPEGERLHQHLKAELQGSNKQTGVMAQRLALWLQRRPDPERLDSLPGGGWLVRYPVMPEVPHAARQEVFHVGLPGLALAAMTPLNEANATAAPVHPPVGLLTGTWRSGNDGTGPTFRLHNHAVHQMGEDGRWQPVVFAGPAGAGLTMLGRQADGEVYAVRAGTLWRLTPDGPEHAGGRIPGDHARTGPDRLPDDGVLRVNGQGGHVVMNDNILTRDDDSPPRLIELLRPRQDGQRNDGPTHEPSTASGVDFQLTDANTVLVLDDRGRLHEGPLDGEGAIHAHRLALPLPGEQPWTITALSQEADGRIHAMAANEAGERIGLVREPGSGDWHSSFALDHPLLILNNAGLQQPQVPPAQRTSIDGHADIGVVNGRAFYREGPDQPWTSLATTSGQPLDGISRVVASPFGFIDRKPVFAQRQEARDAPTEVVALEFHGRTPYLPALDGRALPPGGPLAIAPPPVRVSPQPVFSFDGLIRQMAVGRDKTVTFLDQDLHNPAVMTNRPRPAHAAGMATSSSPLRDLNADRKLEPVSLAVALDDTLHVLHERADGGTELYRLDDQEQWQPVALNLGDLPEGARMQEIRSSRAGLLEARIRRSELGRDGDRWHAVLPAMTLPDGTLAPARIDPQPQAPETPSNGIHQGTNARVDIQQNTRIPLGDAVAGVRTTLLGNTSSDPLSLTSNLTTLATTTADNVVKLARSVSDALVDSTRGFANSLGFTAMPPEQFRRLQSHFMDGQQSHAELSALVQAPRELLDAFTLAPSLSAESAGWRDTDRREATALREQSLEHLLFQLRKVGIQARALDPSLDPKADMFSASNFSFGAAEVYRSATAGLSGDNLMPGIQALFDQLPAGPRLDSKPGLGDRERVLLKELGSVLHTLSAAGVRLPAAPGGGLVPRESSEARRDRRDPHAIRSADIARTVVEYTRLLQAPTPQAMREVADRRAASAENGLLRLGRLGMSSWAQLESFDDVVATFRAEMGQPTSARRQQLMKAMGLPASAAPDQAAARMTTLLNDLYNRSTFFSTQSDAKTVSFSLGPRALHVLSLALGLTGEHIHGLGVERIGDSLEGDAGLVAFFVRQNRSAMTGTLNVGIDPEKGSKSNFRTPLHRDEPDGPAFSMGVGGRVTLGAAMQHGQGAAVILDPQTIGEFSRLLFDVHHPDSTSVLAIGVNQGGIGLDLYETNLDITGGIAVSANLNLPVGKFGGQKPVDPAAKEPPTGTANARGDYSAGLSAVASGALTAHWQEMELHLDHAWRDIFGLEYQGRFDFGTSLDSNLNVNSALSGAIGQIFKSLTTLAVGNQTNLRLAGANVAMGNGNLFELSGLNRLLDGIDGERDAASRAGNPPPRLAPATYKRTLDAAAAKAITAPEWDGLMARLAKAAPGKFQEPNAGMPALLELPSERVAKIDQLIVQLQGTQAWHLERAAAPGDTAWRDAARLATREAVRQGEAWAMSDADREVTLRQLKQLRQQEEGAARERAVLIPGVRIELNMFGTGSLDDVVTNAVGHWHLGGKMTELGDIRRAIPGMDQLLGTLREQHSEINQVRFVFEMRPDALYAINDALEMRRLSMEGRPISRPPTDWSAVLGQARSDPGLYRLATIVPHNTDDNPVNATVGLAGMAHSRTAGTSHQLFQGELQLRYGLYDQLLGAQVLEGGRRALVRDQGSLRRADLEPLALPDASERADRFGAPSEAGERPGLSDQRQQLAQSRAKHMLERAEWPDAEVTALAPALARVLTLQDQIKSGTSAVNTSLAPLRTELDKLDSAVRALQASLPENSGARRPVSYRLETPAMAAVEELTTTVDALLQRLDGGVKDTQRVLLRTQAPLGRDSREGRAGAPPWSGSPADRLERLEASADRLERLVSARNALGSLAHGVLDRIQQPLMSAFTSVSQQREDAQVLLQQSTQALERLAREATSGRMDPADLASQIEIWTATEAQARQQLVEQEAVAAELCRDMVPLMTRAAKSMEDVRSAANVLEGRIARVQHDVAQLSGGGMTLR